MIPFLEAIHALMTFLTLERLFDIGLWLAGAGHFVILIASFQVPYRMHWKEDLRSLMPFNRKLLWLKSGFTVLTIMAFGTLTLALHSELLRGDRAALGGWPVLLEPIGRLASSWMRFTSRTVTGQREGNSSSAIFS